MTRMMLVLYPLHIGSSVYSVEADTESHVLITLQDLLAFITGASQLPPLGFQSGM